MTSLDISQILSSRYRTSAEADKYTEQLRQSLGLDIRAQVARLAIGRSLAMGALDDAAVDSGGKDIPATALFSTENIGAWTGLMVSHALWTNSSPVDSIEALRSSIRGHWHRGALALWADWKACDQDYDKFVETLVRKSDMPDFADSVDPGEGDGLRPGAKVPPAKPQDDSALLSKALDELGIKVQIKDAIHGPRVSRYRVLLLNLSDLVKINRSIPQLGLALNLGQAAASVSNGDEPKTVFIDLPRDRATWTTVGFDRLQSWATASAVDPNQLLVYAGVSVTGEDIAFDLATAPHLFVGGTTGSGKSVCLHSVIASLLFRHTSESLQLALVDPKRVELAKYAKLSNLYRGSIATEAAQAKELMQELVVEMDARYAHFERLGVANIVEARRRGQQFPYIVVVVEEMSALVHGDKNIQPLIERLAEKARAAGIHLVLATQRPDAETFSGLLRSNIPVRIALSVQKGTESKIILDEVGAENLLGQGDMLLKLPGESLKRAHGVYLRPDQVVQAVAKRA